MFKDIIKEKKVVGLLKPKIHQHTADEIKMLNKEIEIFKENFECAMGLLKEAKEEILILRMKYFERPIATVKDMNGVKIKPGHLVFVHQEEKVRKGIVIEVFPDNPTDNKTGFWVDIDCGEGVEGMMSYILEVI